MESQIKSQVNPTHMVFFTNWLKPENREYFGEGRERYWVLKRNMEPFNDAFSWAENIEELEKIGIVIKYHSHHWINEKGQWQYPSRPAYFFKEYNAKSFIEDKIYVLTNEGYLTEDELRRELKVRFPDNWMVWINNVGWQIDDLDEIVNVYFDDDNEECIYNRGGCDPNGEEWCNQCIKDWQWFGYEVCLLEHGEAILAYLKKRHLPPYDKEEEQKPKFEESRKPNGSQAHKEGRDAQNKYAILLQKQGYLVEQGFTKGESDLKVKNLKGMLIKIVSVKAFNLSKSHINGFAHSRTVYRDDLEPEIRDAINFHVPLELAVLNPFYERWWTEPVDPRTFDHWTTPPELAEDLA